MPQAGFQPASPATKWPQTYALDRAATGVAEVKSRPTNCDSYVLWRLFLQKVRRMDDLSFGKEDVFDAEKRHLYVNSFTDCIL
jgi:hypothetical protein